MRSMESLVKWGVIIVTVLSIAIVLIVKSTQAVVEIGTVIIATMSALLAVYITTVCMKRKQKPFFWWSLGLWLFTAGVILEIAFAYGIYSNLLISTYLFIVTLLVEFLALGSLYLKKNGRGLVKLYAAFIAAVAVITIYSLAAWPVGNIIEGYIVFGSLPLPVIIASSLATFPAAAILVIVAAQSYMQKRSPKMLSIIAGVIVVSIAGTLYIVSYPVLLYFSEFIGILLLWLGFV